LLDTGTSIGICIGIGTGTVEARQDEILHWHYYEDMATTTTRNTLILMAATIVIVNVTLQPRPIKSLVIHSTSSSSSSSSSSSRSQLSSSAMTTHSLLITSNVSAEDDDDNNNNNDWRRYTVASAVDDAKLIDNDNNNYQNQRVNIIADHVDEWNNGLSNNGAAGAGGALFVNIDEQQLGAAADGLSSSISSQETETDNNPSELDFNYYYVRGILSRTKDAFLACAADQVAGNLMRFGDNETTLGARISALEEQLRKLTRSQQLTTQASTGPTVKTGPNTSAAATDTAAPAAAAAESVEKASSAENEQSTTNTDNSNSTIADSSPSNSLDDEIIFVSRKGAFVCVSHQPEDLLLFYVTSFVVPIIFSVIIVVGLLGNIIVVTVILQDPLGLTPTNILVMDLSLSDLSFIVFCIPFTGWDYAVNDWVFGEAWCKFNQYLIVVCALNSIYTLVLMSIDRFMAVVYPLACMPYRTSRNVFIAILAKWLLIVCVSLPVLQMHGISSFAPSQRRSCHFLSQQYNALHFQAIFFASSYALPLTLIILLYHSMLKRLWFGKKPQGHRESNKTIESRKRVTGLVAGIVVVFAFCWLPIQLMLVLMRLGFNQPPTPTYVTIQVFAHALGYMNSCVNPIVYAYASETFHAAFRRSSWAKLFGLGTIAGGTSSAGSTNSNNNITSTHHHHHHHFHNNNNSNNNTNGNNNANNNINNNSTIDSNPMSQHHHFHHHHQPNYDEQKDTLML
ncbi:Allatostatin-A receptor, partial [Fragariocoptes setiger]